MIRDYLLSALALMLVGALFVSDRYWVLNNRPMVTEAGSVKIPSEMGHPEWLIGNAGVHFPPAQKSKLALGIEAVNRSRGIWPKVAPGVPPAKLGYVVREIDFLGMPFGYYREEWMGWALYTESPYETVVLPLNDQGLALLNKANGRDVTGGFIYPFWQHLWGWLFVAGVALWAWLRHRHIVKRREELGLI